MKVDGTKQTGSDHKLTMDLPAGSHELTKQDTTNLFWIGLEEK
jgi:hypothetical protein